MRRLGSAVNSKKWHRQPLNDADRVIDDALNNAFGLVAPTAEEGVVWRTEPRDDRYSYEPHSPLPLFLGYLSTTAIREVAEDMLNELGGGDIWRVKVPQA